MLLKYFEVKIFAALFSAYIIHKKNLGQYNLAAFLVVMIRKLTTISRVIMQ